MKTLIYTTAHGDPVFAAMARECVFSARRQGYTGDFFVLTDREDFFDKARCLRTEMPKNRLVKAGLTQFLDRAVMAGYDRILYVDADCVFRKNPETLLKPKGLRLAIETGGPIPGYNTVFFSREEKDRFRATAVPRVNTGTILMPGCVAFDFLQAWESFWQRCPREETCRALGWQWCNPVLMDQPALQLMLFRQGLEWSGYPVGTIGFPLYERDTATAALLHFCGPLNRGKTSHGQNKKIVLEMMRGKNARNTSFDRIPGMIRSARDDRRGCLPTSARTATGFSVENLPAWP